MASLVTGAPRTLASLEAIDTSLTSESLENDLKSLSEDPNRCFLFPGLATECAQKAPSAEAIDLSVW